MYFSLYILLYHRIIYSCIQFKCYRSYEFNAEYEKNFDFIFFKLLFQFSPTLNFHHQFDLKLYWAKEAAILIFKKENQKKNFSL